MAKILIVDDEARILLLIQSLLRANGYETVTANDGNEAINIIRQGDIDVAITDLRMSPIDGLTLIQQVKSEYPNLPIILLTAYASVETAINAMKSGAFDYLTKPFKVDVMLATVKRAVDSIQSGNSVPINVDEPLRYRFENMIATSDAMLNVCEMIQRVAPTSATVLIYGESGTGKEVVAKAIHKNSPRKDGPMVAVNCAALPPDLLESEMFGHVKGAFTGAVTDKAGLFEVADGGTLLLDEISSLPLQLQGKLLRVLEEREIRRVGGNTTIPVNVRVIAASNDNLEQMAANGMFRMDLYYRFAVITIDIPPLRERKEDILPLFNHFISLELPAGAPRPQISNEVIDILNNYRWSGNVRELENAVKHIMTFIGNSDIITPNLLPPRIVMRVGDQRQDRQMGMPTVGGGTPQATIAGASTTSSVASSNNASLKSFLKLKEKEYLGQILADNNGDKEKAAKTLQVSLATLYRKLSDENTEG